MTRTGRPPKPPLERFERQLRASQSGCVEWTGRIDRYGYGQFRPGGRDTSHCGAHRWSYEHFVGQIQPGTHIDHLCRNRKCVNPWHLELVTPRENVMRGLGPAAVNARKTHCIHGHPLTPDNIYTSSGMRTCKICKKATSARNYRKRMKEA
jgi:hypothetical protein